MTKRGCLALFGALAMLSLHAEARGFEILRVRSAAGIEAWLVEDHRLPILSLAAAWEGGAGLDPKGMEGIALLTAGLLDEGAGRLGADRFRAALEKHSVRLSFQADHDALYLSMRSLSEKKEEAFRLLRLAVREPRFDSEAVERIRRQILLNLARKTQYAEWEARRAFRRALFGDRPYGRIKEGGEDSLKRITPRALRSHRRALLTSDRLTIAVVGAITPEALAKALDEIFPPPRQDAPPEKTTAPGIETPPPAPLIKNERILVARDEPQSVIIVGGAGLVRRDPDFIAAALMSRILGGGLSSRLMRRIRVQGGLVYDIHTELIPHKRAGLFLAQTQTRQGQGAETLALIREEMRAMRMDGPTAPELADAKAYLIGAYDLRLDSSLRLAENLLYLRREGLGMDYRTRRRRLIDSVRREDVLRAARRLLNPDKMIAVITGAGEKEVKGEKGEKGEEEE